MQDVLPAGGGRGPLGDASVGGLEGDQVYAVEFFFFTQVLPGVGGGDESSDSALNELRAFCEISFRR